MALCGSGNGKGKRRRGWVSVWERKEKKLSVALGYANHSIIVTVWLPLLSAWLSFHLWSTPQALFVRLGVGGVQWWCGITVITAINHCTTVAYWTYTAHRLYTIQPTKLGWCQNLLTWPILLTLFPPLPPPPPTFDTHPTTPVSHWPPSTTSRCPKPALKPGKQPLDPQFDTNGWLEKLWLSAHVRMWILQQLGLLLSCQGKFFFKFTYWLLTTLFTGPNKATPLLSIQMECEAVNLG